MADTTEKKSYLIDIKSNYQKYVDDLKKAREELDKLKVAQLKLTEEQKKDSDFMEKFNAQYRNAQTEVKNATKILDQATLANKAQKGSYEELYRTWQVAQTQLKLLGGTYTTNAQGVRILSEKYIEQKKVVEDAKRSLDSFGKGIADNRLNVGNYSEAIQGAIGDMQRLPRPLGVAAGGVQRLTAAFKMFIANPIVLAITAIIGVIAGLVKAFKSTDKGSTELAARFEQLKAVLDVLRQRIITLIEAFGHLFRGEFREAGEAFKATVTGIGQQLRDATSAAYAYAYAIDKVKDAESNYISRAAENKNKIAKLEFTAQDRTKSIAERKKALQEALDLGLQEVQKAQGFAKARLDAEINYLAGKSRVRAEDILGFIKMTDEEQKQADQSLQTVRNNNEAKFDDIEKLYAAWLDADTRFYEENKRNIGRMTGFEEKEREDALRAIKEANERKIEAEKERIEAIAKLEQEAEAKRKAAYEKADKENEDFINREIERMERAAEIKQRDIDAGFEYQRMKAGENVDALQTILDLEYGAMLASVEYKNATTNEKLLIDQQYTENSRQLSLLRITQQTEEANLVGSIMGSLSGLFGKQTIATKALSISQALISTYTAGVKAMAELPLGSGPVLRFLTLASIIAAGLLQVKNIIAVKVPGGGGGETSTPTAISSSIPAQRAYAPAVGATFLNQPQLTQPQINALPNQNLLTAADIANEIRKIPAPIVTVEDINARTAEVKKVEVRGTI